jgi:hypothetical protein
MCNRRILIPAIVAAGLVVLAACGRDDAPDLDVGGELSALSVIDAVQLGADQGCHAVAERVSGSVTIKQLDDSDGLVLLIEDGYPLCIDTMETVSREIEMIEASYREDLAGEPTGGMSTDDVVLLMGGSGEIESKGPDGIGETDPNPQPAIEGKVTGSAPPLTATGDPRPTDGPGPTSGGPTSPPDPPPETAD